eukprot:scaffold167968_cov18-Tisochrysis_lutea.AAC.1
MAVNNSLWSGTEKQVHCWEKIHVQIQSSALQCCLLIVCPCGTLSKVTGKNGVLKHMRDDSTAHAAALHATNFLTNKSDPVLGSCNCISLPHVNTQPRMRDHCIIKAGIAASVPLCCSPVPLVHVSCKTNHHVIRQHVQGPAFGSVSRVRTQAALFEFLLAFSSCCTKYRAASHAHWWKT